MKNRNILKVVLLTVNAQTVFDLKVKDKAAQILGYKDYE